MNDPIIFIGVVYDYISYKIRLLVHVYRCTPKNIHQEKN